ncbi:MAG: LLM class flavin-dependent oxidoreductase [Dehalococcoidia bacterium]|nr:LLM class flavin-dependent oxidoreductase [Dehalococcoidia bacterium]
MQVSIFYLPSIGPRSEMEKGMAGLRGDLYQQMLAELKEQAQLADDLGYDSISFTEHHFHIEGFELSNNPILLDLFVALNTKRIRVGQLGIVLPAQNPLRVAEDIAMLDHMSGGRANAGFARGYQRRWVDVMAQQLHGIHGATPGQHDEMDRANREAFEEHFQIIKKAWTEDMLEFRGKYWQIPPEGTPWPIQATKQWGAGVDENDIVRQIGVVPKPLQKPHPPLFQPFASSENTIRWCARENVTAILPPMYLGLQNHLYKVYREESAAAGRMLEPGEGLGVLRDVVVADSDEEALELWAHGPAFCGAAWFAPFGFDRVLREPGKETQLTPQEMLGQALILVGSPETVSRQMETLLRQTPVRWLFAWTYNGLVPHDKIMRSLELFATKVLPRFAGAPG